MKNRTCSMASCALRSGLNPYEVGQKSASKIGSSTSLAAVCTILSRTVGRLTYRSVQAEQRFAPHRGHRRAPAVAVDGCANGKALRALSDCRRLLVTEDYCGGGTAGDQRRCQLNEAHRPKVLHFATTSLG